MRIGWLPSAEDLRSPCLLGCVVELFEWNIIVFNVSSLYIKAFPLLVGISFQIEISLAQPDGCGLLCKGRRENWHKDAFYLTKQVTEGGNHIGNASFVPMELFVKHPLASHPKGGCFQLLPPPPGDWCLRCGQGWPRACRGWGWSSGAVGSRCSVPSQCRWESSVLLRSAADAVVLGSEASPFFHSLSFFFNPPSASHSLTAWEGGVVSGGPCRVPATCLICVGCCRARRQCYHPWLS